jgi:hypothetical protein
VNQEPIVQHRRRQVVLVPIGTNCMCCGWPIVGEAYRTTDGSYKHVDCAQGRAR